MKISIVTPTLNCEKLIRKTMDSLFLQEGVEIEQIVVDGKSTDNTLSLLREYEKKCNYLTIISEDDNGLYDAMNKGILAATGDIIGILNAGDFYANRHVLKQVIDTFEENQADSVYGDLIYIKEDDTDSIVRFWKSGKFDKKRFYKGWMPPHPTFFVKKSVYLKHGFFNTDLKISADYELILRFLLKNGVRSIYIPNVLVYMPVGGVSNSSLFNRFKANQEDRIAWKLNHLKPKFYTTIWKPLSKIKQFFRKK
jgi:glycosyltransferase involved in cell wall biosynthesis